MATHQQMETELREPPRNESAERTVLGAAMIDNSTIDIALDYLTPVSFYSAAHQEIFRCVLELHKEHRPVDYISVAEALERQQKLELVGGRAYLADLEDEVLTTQNIEHYCALVKTAWQKRELISASMEIIDDCHNAEMEGESLFDRTEKRISDITQHKSSKEFQLMAHVAEEALEELKRRSSDPNDITGLRTHYKYLDEMTAGLQKGELIILAGRTSMGKTALALNMVCNVAVKDNRPVAFFSLEMNAQSLHNRLLSQMAQVPMGHIRSGIRSKQELSRAEEANERLAQAPIYIDDSSALTTMQLRARARRLKAQIPELSLVAVDYLQLMRHTNLGRNESRQVEVAEISRSLKILAGELNIPVLAMAQVNRSPDQRGRGAAGRPMLSDLRESGAIEQDADVVLFVHRPDKGKPAQNLDSEAMRGLDGEQQPEEAEIVVGKQRNGATGVIKVLFLGQQTRFVTLAKEHWGAYE
ncbi:replicative DNA helicase [Candidatus Sumerlaeota bacterium]|nr:replicative DNA helicase [Candidatus Sumerlaeota bacterium]